MTETLQGCWSAVPELIAEKKRKEKEKKNGKKSNLFTLTIFAAES